MLNRFHGMELKITMKSCLKLPTIFRFLTINICVTLRSHHVNQICHKYSRCHIIKWTLKSVMCEATFAVVLLDAEYEDDDSFYMLGWQSQSQVAQQGNN